MCEKQEAEQLLHVYNMFIPNLFDINVKILPHKIYFTKNCRKGEFYSALVYNYFNKFNISVNIFYSTHMRKNNIQIL
jgi:hypothetical protein